MFKSIVFSILVSISFLSYAGPPAPLSSSLNALQAVLQEIPNQTHFMEEVDSIQSESEGIEVLFKSGCRHLYITEVSMDPAGVILNVRAVLKEKISCGDSQTAVPLGGLCCSRLPNNAIGCDPGC